ncbi:MAG: hypothetical protein RLZZ450_804 [Pseudomonadota bacterium]
MAWMALGGTEKPIPPPVLQVVGDTPVLGTVISRGAAASANMLEVAKVVCGAVLPNAQDRAYARTRYSMEIGDYDLWRRVCAFRNQAPVREIEVLPSEIISVAKTNDRPKFQSAVLVYRRDSPAYLPNTQFWDLYDGQMKSGVGANVIEPECIYPKLTGGKTAEESQRLFDDAYQALRNTNTPGLRPVCPGSSLVPQPGTPEKTLLTAEEQQTWALQGAINAGLSVFSYVDAVTRGEVGVQLAYDQCEQRNLAGNP